MTIEQVKQAHDLILLMEECARDRMRMEESIGSKRLLTLSSCNDNILSVKTYDMVGNAMLQAGINVLKQREVELFQEIETMMQKGGAQ